MLIYSRYINIYFRYKSLIRYILFKYFLALWAFSFHFLDSILWSTEVLNFDEVQLIYFFLLLLVSYIRTQCQIWDHEDLPLCFLLRVLQFHLLNLILWYILSSYLYMVWRKNPVLLFCTWSCLSAICWKDRSFPIEWSCSLVENQLTMDSWAYFWTLSLPRWSICLSLCQYHPVLIIVVYSFSSNSWNWEEQVLRLCSFSRLFWHFWIPFNSEF